MPHKHGWGHSLASQACALAAAAGVKQLVLFHHDPDRTDDEVDAIKENSRNWLLQRGSAVQCMAAYEGFAVEL